MCSKVYGSYFFKYRSTIFTFKLICVNLRFVERSIGELNERFLWDANKWVVGIL